MKVVWSAPAVRHLQEVDPFPQGQNNASAVSARRRILQTAARIGQMPRSGRSGRILGTREAVVPRTPYIVVYQISSEAVEVIGIWHGAREWPEFF
jgi:plasmid stabilization system protein ParE